MSNFTTSPDPQWLSVSISPVALSLIGIAVATVVASRLRQSNPCDDIPGPFLARWTPYWLIYHARIGDRYKAVHEAHEKYGPIVKIAPNHVSIAEKEALNVVYAHGQHTLDKSDFYRSFSSRNKPSLFSVIDRVDHGRQRRLVSNAFSYGSLQGFAPIVHHIVSQFIEMMDKICDEKRDINILHHFNYYSFDILSDLSFGEPIGMIERESDVVTIREDGEERSQHAIDLVDEREHLAVVMGGHWTMKWISKFYPDNFFPRGVIASNNLDDLGFLQVKKRLESGAERDDILGKLVAAQMGEGDGSALTQEQLAELTAEAVTLLIAGSDTVANSLATILNLIVSNPRVHKKLVKELEDALGSTEPPTHAQVKSIQYLIDTVDEGLRYNGTAIGMPRAVNKEGLHYGGRFYPHGMDVSVPGYTIHHDKTIWGDPENFRPERWAENRDLHQYLQAFGRGPRACIGRNLAYMEMHVMIAAVLLRYDFKVLDKVDTSEAFMRKPVSLHVRVTRRSTNI